LLFCIRPKEKTINKRKRRKIIINGMEMDMCGTKKIKEERKKGNQRNKRRKEMSVVPAAMLRRKRQKV
jgi:hypothetical protein